MPYFIFPKSEDTTAFAEYLNDTESDNYSRLFAQVTWRELDTNCDYDHRYLMSSYTVASVTAYDTREKAYAELMAYGLRASHTVVFICSDYERREYRARELHRFSRSGSPRYRAIPGIPYPVRYCSPDNLDIESFPDWYRPYALSHFVHLAIDGSGLLAYTVDDEKGTTDKQTIIKPGTYLERYAPTMTTADRQAFIAAVKTASDAYKLTFTTDADTIESVYCNGPSSCMSHGLDDYESDQHPVRAYGDSPDLALAYMGTPSDVSGRAIVWPDKKVYTRAYGDVATMESLLSQAGYKKTAHALYGARILAIAQHNAGRDTYLMPYVDGVDFATKDDKYLVLGDDGEHRCQLTNGLSRECSRDDDEQDDYYHDCDHCGEQISYDDTYCDSCLRMRYRCYDCGERYFSDDVERRDNDNGRTYCAGCDDDHLSDCQLCGESVDNRAFCSSETVRRERLRITELCESCAENTQGCADNNCRGLQIANPAYSPTARNGESQYLVTGYFDDTASVCPDCNTRVRCDRTGDLLAETEASA